MNIFIRVFFKIEGLTMKLPLMPKATAIWLIDNTSLSFSQISKFCGLHELEVQAIADGEAKSLGIVSLLLLGLQHIK